MQLAMGESADKREGQKPRLLAWLEDLRNALTLPSAPLGARTPGSSLVVRPRETVGQRVLGPNTVFPALWGAQSLF